MSQNCKSRCTNSRIGQKVEEVNRKSWLTLHTLPWTPHWAGFLSIRAPRVRLFTKSWDTKKNLKHKVTSYHEYVVRIQNGFVQISPRRWLCPRWLHRSQLHLAFSDLLLRCPQAQTSNQGGPWNDNKMLPESPTLRKECYQVDHCEFDKSQKIFHRLKHPIKVGPVLTTMHCNANHQMLPKSPKQWELFFLLVNI